MLNSAWCALLVVLACVSCSGSEYREIEARWRLLAVENDRNIVLEVEVGSRSCSGEVESGVTDAPSTVTISVTVERRVSGDCNSDMLLQQVTVELANPLAGRQLMGCDPERVGAQC